MAIKITSTKESSSDGVKCLVYGKAGIGKTKLMATAPRPIILSAEAGLLSLAGMDIPVIEVNKDTAVQDIYEAKEFLANPDNSKEFDTICLDSITEIGEVLLAALKKENKDPRKAYGDLADVLGTLIRDFRDIKGKNVVFSAKQVRITDDDSGLTSYFAAMPGKQLLNGLPFFFDEVMYMTLAQNEEGESFRVLKTQPEFNHDAKDRSGKLNPIEEPNLTKIFNKIKGVK